MKLRSVQLGLVLLTAQIVRGQCGTTLNVAKPSVMAVATDSIVVMEEVEYYVLLGIPNSPDTSFILPDSMRERNCIAFYNNGNVAYTRLIEGRSYQETWNHWNGKAEEVKWARKLSRKRFERGGSELDASGLRTYHWFKTDTMEYALKLRSLTDTASFHFTDLRKGSSPYSIHIDAECGERREVRFYRYDKDHLFHELYLGYAKVANGVIPIPWNCESEAHSLMYQSGY